jgi:hypothetical protein
MPFVPDFDSTQAAGDLSVATYEDTSTGFTGVTGRLLYQRKFDGDYLVPNGTTTDYVAWPVVAGTGDELEVDDLDKDYCLDVTVTYLNGSSTATTKTKLTLFTGYSDLFLRQLTQALAANKISITAQNFYYNKMKLRVLVDDAEQAVSLLNDQTIAQNCLDEAKKLTDNIAKFFG